MHREAPRLPPAMPSPGCAVPAGNVLERKSTKQRLLTAPAPALLLSCSRRGMGMQHMVTARH